MAKYFLSPSSIIILSLLVLGASGQFFTKSSKSIPRMGRRSDPESQLSKTEYRHQLIDLLIDEFGPNLLSNLRSKVAAAEINRRLANGGKQNVRRSSNGNEFVLANDQPFDLVYGSPSGIESASMEDAGGELKTDRLMKRVADQQESYLD